MGAMFYSRCAHFMFAITMLVAAPLAYAIEREQANNIPHVDQRARDNFLQYLYADAHKAYAIAPGGTWAWSAALNDKQEATRVALERCQKNTQQRCVPYAVNDDIVFDAKQWPRLWGPYLTSKQSGLVAVGLRRGERFPDLVFKDKYGKQRQLSEFRGKVTLLHFWGSWCPPCLREMPLLLQLQTHLQKTHGHDVALLLLQVREPFSESRAWARRHSFDALPLYDSGASGSQDEYLQVRTPKGGRQQLPDRKIAKAFPTSYVLDRYGVVLFVHHGPIDDWGDYHAFFHDAVSRSGR